jgi:translation initiation factor 6
MIYRASLRNSPFIGVYIATGGGVAVAPPAAPRELVLKLEGLLGLKVVQSTVGNISAVGCMAVINSNGIVVPSIVSAEELSILRGCGHSVCTVESNLNSFGNLVCANDRGAIASPWLPRDIIVRLGEILGVEVRQMTIAGCNVVGSAVTANDRGALVHPSASEEEKEEVEGVLNVRVANGTVNGGFKFVRAGIVSGPNGLLVGETTSGPELMQLQEALCAP